MEWQSTPIFLPGEFHRLRSLAGYSPWDSKELDMTERVTFTFIHKPVPGMSPRQGGPSAAVPSEEKGFSALSVFNVPDLLNMLQLIDEHI